MKQLFSALLALLLVGAGPVHAHAKKKTFSDKDIQFSPVVKKAKYSSRSEIKLTTRPKEDLMTSGFAKIGIVEAKLVQRHCRREGGEEVCEDILQKTDSTAELLRKAAESGGDLVVLLQDREEKRDFTEGKKCAVWVDDLIYTYVQNHATGGMDLQTRFQKRCSQYETFIDAYDLQVSLGDIWRNDPELAQRINHAEEFVTAAGTGDMATVERLLDGGIDVNRTTNAEGSLALSNAALMGQVEMVKYLLSRKAKVNAFDRIASPLYQAVFGGSLEVTRILLDKGAKVNAKLPGSKQTALYAAAHSGSVEIMEELIKKKAKVKIKDVNGISPLMVAAQQGSGDAVRILLQHGAQVDRVTGFLNELVAKWTPLHFAAQGGHADAIKALLEGGADPKLKDHYGYTPLYQAKLWRDLSKTLKDDDYKRYARAVDMLVGFTTGFNGYIDETWNVVIQPRFARAEGFSEGLAPVALDTGDDEQYGYINTSGKMVIKPVFHEAKAFSEGRAVVGISDKWGMPWDVTRYGYIDKAGNYVVKVHEKRTNAFSFAEGLAPVEFNGRWGYINRSGNLNIKAIFSWARPFKDDFAIVTLDDKDGFINKKGEIVIGPRFEKTVFGGVQPFAEELAAAHFGDGKWGFINKKGETAIAPRFREVLSFSEGLAGALEKRWGFIDKSGNWAIEQNFYFLGLWASGFYEGLCAVSVKKGKWGYIDKSGTMVLEPVYEGAGAFRNGQARVKVDGKWGLIDRSGKFIVKPRYSYVGPFNEGLAPVRFSGPEFLNMADDILAGR